MTETRVNDMCRSLRQGCADYRQWYANIPISDQLAECESNGYNPPAGLDCMACPEHFACSARYMMGLGGVQND